MSRQRPPETPTRGSLRRVKSHGLTSQHAPEPRLSRVSSNPSSLSQHFQGHSCDSELSMSKAVDCRRHRSASPFQSSQVQRVTDCGSSTQTPEQASSEVSKASRDLESIQKIVAKSDGAPSRRFGQRGQTRSRGRSTRREDSITSDTGNRLRVQEECSSECRSPVLEGYHVPL